MKKKFLLVVAMFGMAIGAASLNFGNNNAAASISIPYSHTRVNVDSLGNEANAGTDMWTYTSMSTDGRYVAFNSSASNLVPNDTNAQMDLFVKDRSTGAVTRINVTSAGGQSIGGNSPGDRFAKISGDGKFVAFTSRSDSLAGTSATYTGHVYRHNMTTGVTEMVDIGLGGALPTGGVINERNVDISADGRYVVFVSDAPNLVANGHKGIFVRDMKLGVTTLLSEGTGGSAQNGTAWRPSISCDGAMVSFSSSSSNLVSNDTNGHSDAFLVDRVGGNSIRNVTLNANTGVVSSGSVHGSTKMSCDGSTILVATPATNLTSGVTGTKDHLYAYDTFDETFELVDQKTNGTLANDNAEDMAVSADGNLVVFQSHATNLDSVVTGDNNSASDIFIRDRAAGTTYRISKLSAATELNTQGSEITGPGISADGRYVTYITNATNVVSGDTNGAIDVFLDQTGFTPVIY